MALASPHTVCVCVCVSYWRSVILAVGVCVCLNLLYYSQQQTLPPPSTFSFHFFSLFLHSILIPFQVFPGISAVISLTSMYARRHPPTQTHTHTHPPTSGLNKAIRANNDMHAEIMTTSLWLQAICLVDSYTLCVCAHECVHTHARLCIQYPPPHNTILFLK